MFYAKTEELIELCKVAAKYRGKYISHMRSEGNQLLPALEELIRISREAGIPAEVYHIKAAGQKNWPKEDDSTRANRSCTKKKDSKSRPTCTPIQPREPGLMHAFRRGPRTAVSRRYFKGSAIQPSARKLPPRFGLIPTTGRTVMSRPDHRVTSPGRFQIREVETAYGENSS